MASWSAILIAAIPLILATGALRDPGKSLHGMLGSALWTTLGPHFVLLGRRGWRWNWDVFHSPIMPTTRLRRILSATRPEDPSPCVT